MATRLSRPVYVIGVGMHPFNNQRLSSESMADVAGMAALGDAGIAFAEVGALYNGYLGGGVTSGVAIAKEFGLTGIPVTHVENASATGSCAFGEAVHAVGGGRVDVAMALGFDDMNRMSGLGRGKRGRVGAEDIMLPAAFFAMWATRRMHDVGTTVDTFAQIAAKNWNHARLNPMAQRQADHEVTPDEVLASTMISYPHTSMMACAAGVADQSALENLPLIAWDSAFAAFGCQVVWYHRLHMFSARHRKLTVLRCRPHHAPCQDKAHRTKTQPVDKIARSIHP